VFSDEDGFIYFNELLYKTMKRRYAPGRTKKKILFEVELQTLEKLEKIMTQQIFQSRKKERQKAVAVNPFLSMMYKSMSFNVWMDIYSKHNFQTLTCVPNFCFYFRGQLKEETRAYGDWART
jgi:hypothetical protein